MRQKIYNTFGIDVYATKYLEYASEEELLRLISKGAIVPPFLHVGGGSNLLFVTDEYHGTILHSRIKDMAVVAEDDASVTVRAGAGMLWDDFVAYCVEHGWYGAENLSYIPGEVGASAVQNIGAYGTEVKDLIVSVETIDIDGNKRKYDVSECQYGYRNSLFKRPEMKRAFVTHVTYRLGKVECYNLTYGAIRHELEKFPKISLTAVRQAIIDIRKSKLPDPKELGNAGSFFKNPIVRRAVFDRIRGEYPQMPFYEVDGDFVKIPAGWLIEQCGWKGKALGHAAVYEKQALILVNQGGASGGDVARLAEAVRQAVHNKFGVDIELEVNFIH